MNKNKIVSMWSFENLPSMIKPVKLMIEVNRQHKIGKTYINPTQSSVARLEKYFSTTERYFSTHRVYWTDFNYSDELKARLK